MGWFLPLLASMAPTILGGIGKLFGGGAGGGYPQFNYRQQIPMPGEDYWSKRYQGAMARPRREASRFSQAATKTTLPGGVRTQAQERIGRGLMDVARRTSTDIERERMGYEVPWAMQQGMWQREDMLRKFLMGKQGWQGIMQSLGTGIGRFGGSQGWWGGGGGGGNQQIMNILMQLLGGGGQGGGSPRRYLQ